MDVRIAPFVLALIFCVQPTFGFEKEFELAAGEIKVIQIDQLISPGFLVLSQNHLMFGRSKISGLHDAIEVLTIGPDAEDRVFTIEYIRSGNPPRAPDPLIVVRNTANLDAAKLIDLVQQSSYLFTAGNPEDAVNTLRKATGAIRRSIEVDEVIPDAFLSLLVRFQEYKEVQELLFEVVADPSVIGLSAESESIQFLRARQAASMIAGQYTDAVLQRCELLSRYKSSRTEHDRYHFDLGQLLLATEITEWVRNGQPSVGKASEQLMANYFNQCAVLFSDSLPGPGITLSQYLTKSREPITDVDAIVRIPGLDEKWRNPAFTVALQSARWSLYNMQEKHHQAEVSIRVAIDEAIANAYTDRLGTLYFFLGLSSLRQGYFAEARYYYRKMLVQDSSQFPGTRYEGTALFNNGMLLIAGGDFEAARWYFERAWQVYCHSDKDYRYPGMKCHSPLDAGAALAQLGFLARENNNQSEAIKLFENAEAMLAGQNDYHELLVWLGLAQSYISSGAYEQASEYAIRAANDPRAVHAQRLEAWLVLLDIALQKEDEDKLGQAISNLSALLNIEQVDGEVLVDRDFADTTFARYRIRFFSLLVKYYGDRGEVERVRRYAEVALNIVDKIGDQLPNSMSWKSAQYALVGQYVKSLFRLNDPATNISHKTMVNVLDRYYSIDHGRERSNFDMYEGGNVLPEDLKLLWEAKLAAERELLVSRTSTPTELSLELAVANDRLYSFRPFRARLSQDRRREDTDLADLQGRMPPGDIFVRYFLDAELSFAFVVTPTAWYVKELPDREVIRSWVSEIEQAAVGGRLRRVMQVTNLSALLPDEVRDLSIYNRLVIVPDDVLHRVPFAALPMPATEMYTPIAEGLQIVRTHSMSHYYLGGHPEFSAADRPGISIFADPAFRTPASDSNQTVSGTAFQQWLASQPRLESTAAEAASIEKLFESTPLTIRSAIGEQATNEFLLSDQTRSSRILHIATHGYYDKDRPDLVGIITSVAAPGNTEFTGFLGMSELLSKPFQSELVVVSGCDTMMGSYYKGFGMRSITRGLLAQGAGAVVGTIWPIADRPTATFMKLFYSALKSNRGNASGALFEAKKELSARGRYRDPKYWAGFVLTSVSLKAEDLNFSF